MKSYFQQLITVSALLTVTGCSSMMSHTGGSDQGYYPGTRSSYHMLADDDTGWAAKSFVALDMPFTAIADTLLIPWDAVRTDKSVKSRVADSERANAAINDAIPPSSPTLSTTNADIAPPAS
ncbi:hypothetical protein TUM12370_00140 [Salmonella enterica subsp. enterica serovar Choleraesuis]|nr:hypothetical protein TUM12370_00140 [Salmonella enterica subsp. enterica serovar Choleraesuis]